MLNLKNRVWLLALICVQFALNAQNIPTIQVNDQDPSHLTPIAKKVYLTKNQFGVFPSYQPIQLSGVSLKTYRGAAADKIRSIESDPVVMRKLLRDKPSFVSLQIPVNAREFTTLDLVRVNLMASGFNVFTSENQKTPYSYPSAIYYRGVVQGSDGKSIASISVFENEIIGSFTTGDGNMVIQPSYDAPGQMILYNDRDFTPDLPFECLTDDLPDFPREASPRGIQAEGDCVRVYLECDYALYQNKGGTTNTVNWITAVFNNVATLYDNENINTAISEVFVWTTPDSYSKTSSSTALNQFKTLRTTFNGDLAHLAALGGNNIGGVAWLDVLCSNYRYAYSNISSTYSNVPTYSWTIEVMTHEMGHNLGSNHTHWCGWTGGALDNCYTPEGTCSKGPAPTNGGTIMSYCHLTAYGINFNNGFGTQPGDKIRAEVAAATCLSPGCGGSGCNAPTGLAISNITQNSATATWNTVSGATSYKFEYKTNAGATWTVVTTTNPNYNMTGLASGTTYNTRVKAVCNSGESTYSSTVNFTTSSGGGGCNTPTNLAASNITETTATISWSAVSGALSYNFQYKLASSSTWQQANVTGTAVNMSGMSPATAYNVRVQAVCNGGNSAFTSTLTFTTLAGYCASKGNNASYEWVKRVNIGTIDRSSGNDGGYYNGTALVTDVSKGNTYTLNYQAGTTGGSATLYWRVWIDFNNNKSFNDAGEQVVSMNSNSTGLLSANIAIPSGAATAKVRMRVSMRYGGYASSCQTFPYGEVEDYSINIKAAGTLINPGDGLAIQAIQDLEVNPNPFQQTLQISFNAPADQEVQLNILDPLGRVLTSEKVVALEGINRYTLNTSHLLAGGYYFQLTTGNNQFHKKLIKLE